MSSLDAHAVNTLSGRRLARLDAAGIGLAVSLVVWAMVSASVAGGDPLPSVALVVGITVCYSGARFLTARGTSFVPVVVLVVAGVLALAAGTDAVSGRPGADPLGYANANGALWAQACAAAALLVVISTHGATRLVAAGAGAVFVGLTIASGSLAASVLLALVAAGAVAASGRITRRWFIVVAAILAGIAIWTTAVLGAGYRFELTRPPSQEFAEESLSTRRLVLWRDAVDLMRAHPVTGVGPRRFSQESAIALADTDTTETHNEFLQQGAETGAVGLGLMVMLFAWAFVRLLRTDSPGAAVAAAAVAMVAIHATVDYILHFALVPLIAAALTGAAVATRKARPPEGNRAS